MVAPTPVRAVRFAGGWLFDRVMAGWDVTVHLTHHADTRPLEILGARVVDLERTLASRAWVPFPQALAVDADLCCNDERVRMLVHEAAEPGQTEITFFSDRWPAEREGGAPAVCHRLSVAARAFKAHALAAAQVSVDAIDPTESFRSDTPARTLMLLEPAV
jgi:hypothetical protein